jgi:plasmid stabilization system protein ParE
MLPELKIRTRARRDLRSLVLYIGGRNGDLIVAERFAQRILARCNDLVLAPGMGSPYGQREGVRKINEGAYKILYRATPSKIIVLRIWDGRRGTNPRL